MEYTDELSHHGILGQKFGGLAVTTVLSGTAGISKAVALGEAIISDVNYNRAKKV